MKLTDAINTYYTTLKPKVLSDAQLERLARALGWVPPRPKPVEPVLPSDEAIAALVAKLDGKGVDADMPSDEAIAALAAELEGRSGNSSQLPSEEAIKRFVEKLEGKNGDSNG